MNTTKRNLNDFQLGWDIAKDSVRLIDNKKHKVYLITKRGVLGWLGIDVEETIYES